MPSDQLKTAIVHVEKLRYGGDRFKRKTDGDIYAISSTRRRVYQSGLKISPSVTPKLENTISRICDTLFIPRQSIEAFVYASPEISAQCVAGHISSCILVFSSSLINLLSEAELEFVVGHEIGHFLFGHGVWNLENSNDNVEYFVQQRSQEISADRVGLEACGSLDTAIRALIKTLSGLDEEHLRFDVGEFVAQIRHAPDKINSEEFYSSHPSIFVRTRALLWFSSVNRTERSEKHYKQEIKKIDAQIEHDFVKYVDGPTRALIAEIRENLAIWLFVARIVGDGIFDKSEQNAVIELFGESVLSRLKQFLANVPILEVQSLVSDRVNSIKEQLKKTIPSDFDRVYQEVNDQINGKLDNIVYARCDQ